MDIKQVLANSILTKIDPQTQLSQWATSKITKGVATNVNQLLNKTGLSDKVYEFAKVMRDIRVSIVEEQNNIELSVFNFPVTPHRIDFTGDNVEEVVQTIGGKVNYLKDSEFHTISFTSFFPAVYYPFSDSYKVFGINCIDIIEKMKTTETPLKLVITGVGIVQLVYITKFTYNTTPCGDIEYSIEFKEARTPEIYESSAKTYTFKPKAFDLSR